MKHIKTHRIFDVLDFVLINTQVYSFCGVVGSRGFLLTDTFSAFRAQQLRAITGGTFKW